MRKIITVALSAFVIGGTVTGAVLSQAQPAPAQQVEQTQGTAPDGGRPGMVHPGMPHPDMDGPGMHRPGMMGWTHQHRPFNPRAFGLIYRQKDRQLAPADVQKIAEAFLLWNGNHTWKITNVAPTPDGPIGFSVTTPEGSVVAKFTMDPHTGHISRVG